MPHVEPLRMRQIIRHVWDAYSCPRISTESVTKIARDVMAQHGHKSDFNYARYRDEVDRVILGSSFRDIAVTGTGPKSRISYPKIPTRLDGPMVLELVHLTDIEISPFVLERVRQTQGRIKYLDRVARRIPPSESSQDWEWPSGRYYPRGQLKLFLSDGFMELEAVEQERLSAIELGVTPMGTKIRLENILIVGGIAYLREENVTVLGGCVPLLQRQHRIRFYKELDGRMDEEDVEAQSRMRLKSAFALMLLLYLLLTITAAFLCYRYT